MYGHRSISVWCCFFILLWGGNGFHTLCYILTAPYRVIDLRRGFCFYFPRTRLQTLDTSCTDPSITFWVVAEVSPVPLICTIFGFF
ncbi:hypothetical protein BJ138DRAFT_1163958 [Hygrophoropsis aurantiaca]|uniref:Uncharacterized protein n=1 Tax=Hygrophoropsis aurantiaca TaxID=72124 RepID=A0ACB7ZYS7_9AGAM|nr:hypothetical protein BJ138DRAFT_1163958 [Hygrophoropsis aurantiaca]